MFHIKQHLELQWDPVNTVTNGPKRLARLMGWPYYQGRLKFHDLRAVMTNKPYIAFSIVLSLKNNLNVDIVYSNWKNLLNMFFQYMKLFKNSAINR